MVAPEGKSRQKVSQHNNKINGRKAQELGKEKGNEREAWNKKIRETKRRVANIQERGSGVKWLGRRFGNLVRASDLKSGGPALTTRMYVFKPVSSCSCRIVNPATPTNFLLLDSLRHTLPNQEKKTTKKNDMLSCGAWLSSKCKVSGKPHSKANRRILAANLELAPASLTPASPSHLTNLTRTESWVS